MINDEIKRHAAYAEEIIYQYLPKEEGYQKTIFEAMNYSMKAGGKRLRPVLMMETFRLFGGEGKVIEPFMAAIEMVHTYSLIHDDLPALDNDEYRRGRKTSHVVFGEAMAILAGDALLNYAYETACKAFDIEPGNAGVCKALAVLAKKPGVYGMIGGQVADVEMTGKPLTKEELIYIYENKTGALIEASMMIGALLAEASDTEVAEIEKIGSDVGMAFQIQDDILDVTGDSEILGKPLFSDEENGKQTYVTIYGIDAAKEKVAELSNQAVSRLSALPYENPFLRELLIALINRDR